jgi:hypothetical protein
MLYCPKCATPLDQAERAKMVMREQNTMDEMVELRKLLKKYLGAEASKEEQVLPGQKVPSDPTKTEKSGN